MNSLESKVDHLVVMAATLEAGVRWCEATLGITPGPGGEHALFGTHNRLFKIATSAHPQAYFEIIAINPHAPPATHPGKRWFDMDDEALRLRCATAPQLIHFVAATPAIAPAMTSLAAMGIDRGRLLQASRPTPQGLLSWQISVRDDGQRLWDGTLPTLIQWGDRHPSDTMPHSGVGLLGLTARHPDFQGLARAHAAMGLQGVAVEPGETDLVASLQTPKGLVTLRMAR
jgi:hypothetical protein